MKTNFKYDRISEKLKQVINDVIDQRIEDLDFITVVDVEITKDLQDAKVYVQIVTNDEPTKKLRILSKNEGLFKKEIAKKVQLRKIPNLYFYQDDSLENYNKIDNLLKKV